jgi:hypothetical protein
MRKGGGGGGYKCGRRSVAGGSVVGTRVEMLSSTRNDFIFNK